MEAQCTIQVPRININAQALTAYLCVMGAIFTCILVFLALVLLSYICQMFFLSLSEVLRLFNGLDPILRLLLMGLAAVSILYVMRARAAAKVRDTHEQ